MTHRTGIFFPSSGICLELETGGCRSFAALCGNQKGAGRMGGRKKLLAVQEKSLSPMAVSPKVSRQTLRMDRDTGSYHSVLSDPAPLLAHPPPHSLFIKNLYRKLGRWLSRYPEFDP